MHHVAGRLRWLLVFTMAVIAIAACEPQPAADAAGVAKVPAATAQTIERPVPALVDDLERRTFDYFWELGNPVNGLVPDRWPTPSFSSIAAVGFGLTSYGVGVERGWITRDQAIERTLATLRFFARAPQGPSPAGASGHKGFFYHFLDMRHGHRYEPWVELSSVDTGLLMMGVLFAQSYYDRDDAREREIRDLADALYRAVEWPWLQRREPLISMGWHPESGFIAHDWAGYNEAMLVYILALGSPTHPVGPEAWEAWTRSYDRNWGVFQGQEHLSFAPHFGHQYTHAWIDFRGIRDAYMRRRGIDYFENSRRATLAQRAYAIENPMRWKDYGDNVWGLTASDGPQSTTQEYLGEQREFRQYSARGAGLADAFDDGTLAPTAALASIAFAPEVVIPAAEEMHRRYGDFLYSDYGFLDAFNPSFEYEIPVQSGRVIPGRGWVAGDYLGIDQGPILLMIANHRNGFVWEVMKRNRYIRRGLERAGFTGGWLAAAPDSGNGATAGAAKDDPGAPASRASSPPAPQPVQ